MVRRVGNAHALGERNGVGTRIVLRVCLPMRRRLEVCEKTHLTMLAGAELNVTSSDSIKEVIKTGILFSATHHQRSPGASGNLPRLLAGGSGKGPRRRCCAASAAQINACCADRGTVPKTPST